LAVSLYAPDVAKIASYIQCEVKASSSNVIQPCDCNLNGSASNQEQSSAPDKQNKISQETNWKYVVTKNNLLQFYISSFAKNYLNHSCTLFSSSFVNDIFHPPRC